MNANSNYSFPLNGNTVSPSVVGSGGNEKSLKKNFFKNKMISYLTT